MKKLISMVLIALSFLAFMPMNTSCEKPVQTDGQNANINTEKIDAIIAECETVLSEATTDDYPQEAIDAFENTLNTVKNALNGNLSQQQVDNMTVQLEKAKKDFYGKAFSAVSDENILMYFDFNEEGDVLESTGKLRLSATSKTGPAEIFGTNLVKPTFVEGVKGTKAINFTDGAHLEIAEYNFNDICKEEISIAVWVNPKYITPGNYIFSLNYWNTMKFNLQEQGKPFMTVATDKGICDADNQTDESAKVGEWNHFIVTVSLKTHQMKFYVNGALTMTWTDAEKPQLAGTSWKTYESPTGKTLPIMIGASTTYEEALSWSWDWEKTPESWLSANCFQGAIDNLAIYDIAMTDGQARTLYNREK